MRPPKDPVLPFVELPRRCRIRHHRKGGSAGFLGKAYDPYRMYQIRLNPSSWKICRCARRSRGAAEGSLRTAQGINGSMPDWRRRWAITP